LEKNTPDIVRLAHLFRRARSVRMIAVPVSVGLNCGDCNLAIGHLAGLDRASVCVTRSGANADLGGPCRLERLYESVDLVHRIVVHHRDAHEPSIISMAQSLDQAAGVEVAETDPDAVRVNLADDV
jgi:hypothetical protein